MKTTVKFRAVLHDTGMLETTRKMNAVPRIGEIVHFGPEQDYIRFKVSDVYHFVSATDEDADDEVVVVFDPVYTSRDVLMQHGWKDWTYCGLA